MDWRLITKNELATLFHFNYNSVMKAIVLFILTVALFFISGCKDESPLSKYDGYWALYEPIDIKDQSSGTTKLLIISGRSAVVHKIEAQPGEQLPKWMGSDSSTSVSFRSQVWEGNVDPDQNTLVVADMAMKLAVKKYETGGLYEKGETTILQITYPDSKEELYWRVPPSTH